jgi:hypothetical protein
MTLSLSPPYFFANDSTNSTNFNLAELTSSSYMIFYYDSVYDFENNIYLPGILNAKIAYISSPSSPTTTDITFSNTTSLSSSLITYYFAATTLDNSTVAIAFIDANQNNAVVSQIVKVQSIEDSEILFGSSWIVNNGANYQNLPTGLIDIDIMTVSTNSEFVVVYTDLTNNGVVVATLGQVSTR